jgi:hypothetical protein
MPDGKPAQPGLPGPTALPLVVAVTGHRDLLPAEVPGIRQAVRTFLAGLAEAYPERPLHVMSPLAEGADRLVAEIAIDMSLDLVVPLPMRKSEYMKDFDTRESREEFERLCGAASRVLELRSEQDDPRSQREQTYARLGVFLSAHCHVLLAVWDGKPAEKVGGTAQVVVFHHDNVMPGYAAKSVATQQMLVDDESDLVYHVVCSRDRPGGEPEQGLRPLDCYWFTKDERQPRSPELPPQHEKVFRRSSEFSRDALKHADRINAQRSSLLGEIGDAELRETLHDIDHLFGIADWLAIHFQKKTLLVLRITHVLAFLMGLAFILYSDLGANEHYLYTFLALFAVASVVQLLATRRAWHRKYLDYRTLAEGLRVQFYWAMAGIANLNPSRFMHDSFLQTQDPELGWIRNAMRYAGTLADTSSESTAAGLEFAITEWVGNEHRGQLAFFGRKAEERLLKHRVTQRLGRLSLAVSVIVVAAFLLGGSATGLPGDYLVTIMGTTLLLFAVRHGYAYATAEKELIKQYEVMLRIFGNARRRLSAGRDDDERRLILQALGASALDEHASWILMHRERSIEQTEIWRIGSGG